MKTAPFYKLAPNRVWRTYLGGRNLDAIEGKAAPEDSHFPEDWILSTTLASNVGRESIREGISSVLLQTGETIPLPRLLDAFPDGILGEEHRKKYGKQTAFLLKFLDSSIRLHLQCHPTVAFAQKFLNSPSGKSEGYYILGIRPGCEGYIYLGFQNPPAPEEFRRMIEEQDIAAMLACFEKIPVRPGEAFYVPGGFPHAIGEGVFMIELMEPTDFAVRIEFERGGCLLPEKARFMNRGIDFAISMFDFQKRSAEAIRNNQFVHPLPLPVEGAAERESLFDRRSTNCLRAERIVVHGDAAVRQKGFRVLIVTQGSGTLEAGGESCELKQYDRILIPAASEEIRFRPRHSHTMEVVAALPPEV